MGVRIEADAAALARDRRDAEAEQVALKRAEAHLDRLRLTGEVRRSRGAAELTGGEAEHSRAVGDDDPALWAAAAEAWDGLGAPYRRVYASWREAEALVRADDRRRGGDGRLGGAALGARAGQRVAGGRAGVARGAGAAALLGAGRAGRRRPPTARTRTRSRSA